MNKKDICKNLEQNTYRIKSYDEDELINEGTGFCFNNRGCLITAAHVIDNGKPLTDDEVKNNKILVKASRKNDKYNRYNINLCGIRIDWPNGPFREDIIIDLAVLNPADPIMNAPHLKIADKTPKVGADVIMAGFPDELEFPLLINKKIDRKHLNKVQSKKQVDKNLDYLQGMLIMQKSGMIGFSEDLVIDPQKGDGFKLNIGINYIDNAMHSGASGGPVVNNECKVVGVITKRAVTGISYPDLDNPNQEIPSGSTLSITPKTVIDYTKYQISQGGFVL